MLDSTRKRAKCRLLAPLRVSFFSHRRGATAVASSRHQCSQPMWAPRSALLMLGSLAVGREIQCVYLRPILHGRLCAP